MERNGMRFISQVASCLSRSSSDPWNRMPVTPVRIVVCRARHSSLVSYPPHSLRTEPKVNGSNWSEMWGWDKRGTPEETWKRRTLESYRWPRLILGFYSPVSVVLSFTLFAHRVVTPPLITTRRRHDTSEWARRSTSERRTGVTGEWRRLWGRNGMSRLWTRPKSEARRGRVRERPKAWRGE